MVKFNNPAGRLLSVLETFGGQNQTKPMEKFTSDIGVTSDWESLCRAVVEIRQEFLALEKAIELLRDNTEYNNIYEQFSQDLNEIRNAVGSFNINMPSKVCLAFATPSAVTSLRYMARLLPEESQLTKAELDDLRNLCDELRDEILKSKLSPLMKEWLLDLVKTMVDGIDRYTLRGKRGLRKDLYELVGSLALHQADAGSIKKEAPGVWDKLTKCVNWFNEKAERIEPVFKAIGNINKAVSYFSGTSEAPRMLNRGGSPPG